MMGTQAQLRETVAAGALCLLLLLVFLLRVDPLAEGDPMWPASDHINYIAMWSEPGAVHYPPFCYRVLTPSLVRLLPLPRTPSFTLFTALMLFGSGLLTYLWLRRLRESHVAGLIGVVLFFSLNWGAKYLVFDVYRPEPALFFFTLLTLFSYANGRRLATALSLVAAVAAKESALFLVPWLLLWAWGSESRGKSVRDIAIAVTPAIITFLALRWFITPASGYDPIALARETIPERLTGGLLSFVRGATLGTWGVLIPAAALSAPRAWAGFARRAAPFMLLVLAQPLVASNVDRLIVYAFPAVIPLAVAGLGRWQRRFRLANTWMFAFAGAPLVLVLVKSSWQSPSPEQRLAYLAGVALLIVLLRAVGRRRHAR